MWRLLRPDAAAVLDDEFAKKSLARYFAVMQNEKQAKFMIAKKTPADFTGEDTFSKLWTQHSQCQEEFARIEREIDIDPDFPDISKPDKSLLDLKSEIASRILQNCHFCSRKCGVDRTKNKVGYCRCGNTIEVSSICEHMGEEPELVPSGTIFTMGCTIRCCHCQNWTISQWIEAGYKQEPRELAREVERLRLNGCRNVNLVGGEPTPWLSQWLETFKHVSVNVPIVWNSNAYYSKETADLLASFADVYLLDFKYGLGDCALRISGAPDYWRVCTANHMQAAKHGELIIRVLVLPNHLECCTKSILNWIGENLDTETRVNLMFQYRPEWQAHSIHELRRELTENERRKAVGLAEKAGLKNFIT
jgi:putative pyruvate formate lyase activating enzyme